MWKQRIPLEEAIELSFEPKHEESHGKSRWTETMFYVIKWENSPTGYVGFTLEVPLSFEQQGISDVNYESEIELLAVKPVEVTTIDWQVVK